jgi:hypothetical protein
VTVKEKFFIKTYITNIKKIYHKIKDGKTNIIINAWEKLLPISVISSA